MISPTKTSDGCWPAPAKLNLFLHITGRRPDGYHDLQTLFQILDWGDELRFEVNDSGRIGRTNHIDGIPESEDICVRAAQLLQNRCEVQKGVQIELLKHIPMGAGLGGGSSDAATVLCALNHLWSCGLTQKQLAALGLELGADVPVFIFGRSAFAEGVGERLRAIELGPAWYVVLVPQVTVSTAEIFAARELTRNTKAIKIAAFSTGQGHNDLQSVACERFPEIARHMNWLGKFSAAMMTGSGACVFGAFDDESAARSVLEQLPADMKGFAARGLDRHPLYVESA